MTLTKTLKAIVLILVSAFLLSSCNGKEEPEKIVYSYLTLTASVQSLENGRDGLFGSSSEVGVFMTSAGTSEVVGEYGNVRHSATFNSGTFPLLPSGDGIILPDDGSMVDIAAYYPYAETLNPIGEVMHAMSADLSDQTDRRPPMIMTAQAGGMNKVMNKGTLVFIPVYSGLTVKLTYNAVGEVPEDIEVRLEGISCKADIDLMTGKYISYGEASSTTLVRIVGAGMVYDALVPAQNIPDNAVLKVTAGTEVRTIALKSLTESFEPNKSYEVNVDLTPEDAEAVLVKITDLNVSDWENDFNDLSGEIYN